jgi:hypothetical protein
MTVCAYVNPFPYPALISDLVISFDDGKRYLTPSGAGFENSAKFAGWAPLVRKRFTQKVGPSVYAAAGDLEEIIDFFTYLPARLAASEGDARLGRRVGDFANDFNRDFGRDVISVLGYSWMQTEAGLGVNVLGGRDNYSLKTTFFNECFATGTGAKRILWQIGDFDSGLSKQNIPNSTPQSRLIGLIGALNAAKIYNDIEHPLSATWGGYLECSLLNPFGEFIDDMNWSHLAFVAENVEGRRTIRELGKQVHYYASSDLPRLCVKLDDGRGSRARLIWPILDALEYIELRKQGSTLVPDQRYVDWSEFTSSHFTVSVVLPRINKTLHRTLNSHEWHLVTKRDFNDLSLPHDFVASLVPEEFW